MVYQNEWIKLDDGNRYLQPHLSAYIRGVIKRNGEAGLLQTLTEKELSLLTDEDMEALIRFGRENELKLYHYKIKDDLPRVQAVLGFLRGIQPESLLDVGRDGFGAEKCPEINLYSRMNTKGKFLCPFTDKLDNN